MCLFRIFLNMIVCTPTYPMNYNVYIYIHRIMYVEHDTTMYNHFIPFLSEPSCVLVRFSHFSPYVEVDRQLTFMAQKTMIKAMCS